MLCMLQWNTRLLKTEITVFHSMLPLLKQMNKNPLEEVPLPLQSEFEWDDDETIDIYEKYS